jgi:S-adenosylmethionine hydrolase
MPVITLLTDFGTSDSYVAEMKAALYSSASDMVVVDISHTVAQGDVRSAQYLLGRSWHRFARGTVHVIVVDPGVGTERRALAAEQQGHRFIAPDNGLLTPVLEGAHVVELPVGDDASATFHGRDVFAPAAARLAKGESLRTLGPSVVHPHLAPLPVPFEREGSLYGEVVYVDRFGTLITNIPRSDFGGEHGVRVGGEFYAQSGRTFRDVEQGELVAFVGSGGTVEIAARDQSAAQVTGVGIGGEVRLSLG